MSIFGTPSVQHAAGLTQAEAASARNADAKRPARPPDKIRRGADEVDVATTQAADAVRSLKGNADEETADDRQEQDHYAPQREKPAEGRPRLDVKG